MLNKLMNLIWFVFGGLLMGLGWWLTGLLMAITVVGLPWARSCFVIGKFNFLPFGKEPADREDVSGEDIGTGILGSLGNVVWLILCGWWLAIGHLLSAVLCFITIIGIPFGFQHLKLAKISLAPVGKTIVSS